MVKEQPKDQDGFSVKTPFWSFTATGRSVLTVIGVTVLLAAVGFHHYADANATQQNKNEIMATLQKKADQDVAYQQEVVKYLQGIMWVQMQPEKDRAELAKKMEVPEVVQTQLRANK